MRSDKLPVYAFFFMLSAFAAFFGSMFGVDSNNEWYQNLYKPSIVPPDYVFGIVWSILYVLIAVAGARIYFISKKDHKKGMTLWLSQLLVNALFSPLFFGFQSPILGFIDTLILFILLALLVIHIYRFEKVAFYCLLPYLAWVTFAMTISFLIMIHPFL